MYMRITCHCVWVRSMELNFTSCFYVHQLYLHQYFALKTLICFVVHKELSCLIQVCI